MQLANSDDRQSFQQANENEEYRSSLVIESLEKIHGRSHQLETYANIEASYRDSYTYF